MKEVRRRQATRRQKLHTYAQSCGRQIAVDRLLSLHLASPLLDIQSDQPGALGGVHSLDWKLLQLQVSDRGTPIIFEANVAPGGT